MTTDETEGVAPCPVCIWALDPDCSTCCGTGEVVVDWALYLGCSEEDAAKSDAAWKRHEAAGPK